MADHGYDDIALTIDFKNNVAKKKSIEYTNILLDSLADVGYDLDPIVLPAGPDDASFPLAIINSTDQVFSLQLTGKQLTLRVDMSTRKELRSNKHLLAGLAQKVVGGLALADVIPEDNVEKIQYLGNAYFVPQKNAAKTIATIGKSYISIDADELTSYAQYYEVKDKKSGFLRLHSIQTVVNNNTAKQGIQLTISYAKVFEVAKSVIAATKELQKIDLNQEVADGLEELTSRQ